jgi:hypothetical protein
MNQLEFSFVTNQEKLIIMSSIPEKQHIEALGKIILTKRKFTDLFIKETFYNELTKLIYNRSLGTPKKMKKIKDSVQ